MRIVTDAEHNTWICLEPPVRGGEQDATVEVECNSGAERVTVSVPRNWEEMPEAEFVQRILTSLGR